MSDLTSGPQTPTPIASIRTQLAFAFCAMLALIVGMGIFHARQLETVGVAAQDIRDVALPKILMVNELQLSFDTHYVLAQRRKQATDFRQLARIVEEMRAARDLFEDQLATLDRAVSGPAEQDMVQNLTTLWGTYNTSLRGVLDLKEQGELRRARAKMETETQALAGDVRQVLSELVQAAREETARMSREVDNQLQRGKLLSFISLSLGAIATLGALLWVARNISQPLRSISAAMQRLTEGADETPIPDPGARSDEIAVLAQAAAAFRCSMINTKQLATEVERERSKLAATVRNMPIGLCMFDLSGHLTVANRAFQKIFDVPRTLLVPGAAQASVLAEIGKTRVAEGDLSLADMAANVVFEAKPRSAIWSLEDERHISVIFQPTPDGWMMICEDVTDRIEAEKNIRRMARQDALTGLANRLAFQEAIDAAFDTAEAALPVAVMLVDLDRFKYVNDTLGHPVGDQLLQQVAARLNWVVGEDDMVARLGGDEFAIIQAGQTQPEAAIDLGQQVIDQLHSIFPIEDHQVSIGGSVGIALLPNDGQNTNEIMRHADLALYEVKENGKGHCRLFEQSMSERQSAMQSLEQALRDALQADEFQMLFQPIYDIRSGDLYGAEALLRWQHPVRGLLPAAEFIPLAEELGLMRELGRRVLAMSFETAATWPEDQKISINLSPTQFHTNDVLSDILQAVDAAGLDPARVELEITETVLLDKSAGSLEALAALRKHGMKVSLDDFGTGYSSLRHLRAFPFDRVKIDTSFVGALSKDPSAAEIVSAICALCASFGIKVIAEGVETEDQLEFVRKAGCAIGQGTHLGAPMPGEAFGRLARSDGSAASA